ncbi:MAG: hypothetical protein KDA85_06670, partial [Planctomycetaceae bacterium]|nr:hypothetical protein [Planctomycetaceae bacterium]
MTATTQELVVTSPGMMRSRLMCHTLAHVVTVTSIITAVNGTIVGAGDPVELTTEIRRISSPAAEPAPAMAPNQLPANNTPTPTTPSAKLPQYQQDFGHRSLAPELDANNPRIRLILATPHEPVVLEASITIDGQPFRSIREKRIQQLLDELAKPPAPVEPAPVEPLPAEPDLNEDNAVLPGDGTDTPETPAAAASDSGDAVAENKTPSQDKVTQPNASDAQDAGPAPPTVNPATVAPYVLPATVIERLRRYAAATEQPLTAENVRWLLTNWLDGPEVLMLQDNFQRFRAHERPAFLILDNDRDGTISSDEIADAAMRIQECDLNRDDIVDYQELAKAAADPRRKREFNAGKLLYLLPSVKSAGILYQQLAAHYNNGPIPRLDANRNGQFDADELAALLTMEPDLKISVQFDTREAHTPQLTISTTSAAMHSVIADGKSDGGELLLQIHGTPVLVSAVQGTSSDQISLGAVMDGYPLLPSLDARSDGRFTLRELREVEKRLRAFDRNRDDQISAEESAPTIRVCLGLGPIVHSQLIEL